MEKGKIEVTLFIKPHGKKEVTDIPNVYKDDADFITKNKIKVSMEEASQNNFAIYFDYGLKDEEDEPIEHIEMSAGKSCEDTIKQGVEAIKKKMNGINNTTIN